MLRKIFLVVALLLPVNLPLALYAKDIQTCVSCHSEVDELSVLHRTYLTKDTYKEYYRDCIICHSDFNSVFTLHREYIGLD